MKTEVGRWNLETAGMLVFDKRLGCLDFDSEGEEFGRKMVEANSIVFRLAGNLKLSYPLYRVRCLLVTLLCTRMQKLTVLHVF